MNDIQKQCKVMASSGKQRAVKYVQITARKAKPMLSWFSVRYNYQRALCIANPSFCAASTKCSLSVAAALVLAIGATG